MENRELKSFKDLNVWQKSADLAAMVYKITDKFPRSELYGIVNQMRRAVISISSNLAEGFKRTHKKEKLQFYNVAYASTSELESQIEVSKKLGFLSENDYQDLISAVVEVSKMVNGLIRSLNSKSYILNSRSGIVALPAMLLIGGIIVEIGIAGLLVSYFLTQSNFGVKLSAQALAAAQTGVKDATLKIIRDKDFSDSYSINIGNQSSQITVCKDFKTVSTFCDTQNSGKHEIISLGIVQKKQRKIQAILNVNSITGEVKIESVKEIEI